VKIFFVPGYTSYATAWDAYQAKW